MKHQHLPAGETRRADSMPDEAITGDTSIRTIKAVEDGVVCCVCWCPVGESVGHRRTCQVCEEEPGEDRED